MAYVGLTAGLISLALAILFPCNPYASSNILFGTLIIVVFIVDYYKTKIENLKHEHKKIKQKSG